MSMTNRKRDVLAFLRVHNNGNELFKASAGGGDPAGLALESASIELILVDPNADRSASLKERPSKSIFDVTIAREDDGTPTVKLMLPGDPLQAITWEGRSVADSQERAGQSRGLVDLVDYIIVPTDTSRCGVCYEPLFLLAPRSLEPTGQEPLYYLCRCGKNVIAGDPDPLAEPESRACKRCGAAEHEGKTCCEAGTCRHPECARVRRDARRAQREHR